MSNSARSHTIATLVEAMNSTTVDDLKKLAALLTAGKLPTRKGELINLITGYLQGDSLQALWSQLDRLQQAAVAEAVHSPQSYYQKELFISKYGQSPDWGSGRHGYYDFKPSKLNLFFYNTTLPEDLKQRLKPIVPPPPEVTALGADQIPDTVQLEFYDYSARTSRKVVQEIPIVQRSMESAATQDLLTVLRLIQAGKVAVSDKTRYPGAATLKTIAAVLQGGDFYSPDDESKDPTDQKIGDIRSFAWCLLVQAAGLAELSGKKLQLTKAGQTALTAPPAVTLRSIWKKWLKTTLLDEFRRIDEIKGQTGKGQHGLTAASGRRTAIVTALSECAIGQWLSVNEFFRYLRAKQHNFEITRDPWTLYICEAGYGSLGYEGFHDWKILQGRYALCFLFEYAATLGLIDVAYIPPYSARRDYGDLWGTDDLAFLSRYDGLQYLRLTSLGAYCLGLANEYLPTPIEIRPILSVMSNLELVVTEELTMSDRLLLELYLKPVGDRVWQFDSEKLLGAVETGHSVADLREFLSARSRDALPQPVEQFLSDIQARSQGFTVQGTAMLIECENPALAALIANDSRTRKLCLLAGDRHLVVAIDSETKFRTALKKLGYVFPR